MSKNVKVHRHLQTGTRLVEPADDVGESSKLSKINGTLKTNAARIQILQNALSFTQAQDGAMANVGHMIKRVSEIKSLFDSPISDVHTRANYDEEFKELQKEIRNVASSKWNGISLFSNSESRVNIGTAKHPDALSGMERLGGDPLSLQRAGLFGHLKATGAAPVDNSPPVSAPGTRFEVRIPIQLKNNSGRLTLKQGPFTAPDLFTVYHGNQKLHEVMYGLVGGVVRTMANGVSHTTTANQPTGTPVGGGYSQGIRLGDPGNIDYIDFGRGVNSGNTSRTMEIIINEGDFPVGTMTGWDMEYSIEYDPIEPDLNDPVNIWSLGDFSQQDFIRFENILTDTRAQNASEQHRISNEISELSSKQIDLEKAVEAIDGLDYARAMGQFNRTRDNLHINANLVSAAKEMENVLYTDFLGD